MSEIFIVAFTTLFATIGPFDVAAVFSGLSANFSNKKKTQIALKAIFIAACILLTFAFFGQTLLKSFGISMSALRTSGGILLLLMAIEMVFGFDSGATTTLENENEEASTRADISVFPVATPLIAGPGAMGAVVLLMTQFQGDSLKQAVVIGALFLNLVIVFILLILASKVQKIFGITGVQVISRVMGVILAALAVQFIFDGISSSGLIPATIVK